MNYKISWVIFIIIATTTAGCSLRFEGTSPSTAKFDQICERDAGLQIYRPTRDVEGFFHAGIVEIHIIAERTSQYRFGGCSNICRHQMSEFLRVAGYAFVEAEVTSSRRNSISKLRPGMYRFELASADHPLCAMPLDSGQVCITAKPIKQITAEYEFVEKRSALRNNGEILNKTSHIVMNRRINQNIYLHNEYTYSLDINRYILTKCKNIDKINMNRKKLTNILIPRLAD